MDPQSEALQVVFTKVSIGTVKTKIAAKLSIRRRGHIRRY